MLPKSALVDVSNEMIDVSISVNEVVLIIVLPDSPSIEYYTIKYMAIKHMFNFMLAKTNMKNGYIGNVHEFSCVLYGSL